MSFIRNLKGREENWEFLWGLWGNVTETRSKAFDTETESEAFDFMGVIFFLGF